MLFMNSCPVLSSVSFNTDDGIRRAAIIMKKLFILKSIIVSIPMTVLGGLQ